MNPPRNRPALLRRRSAAKARLRQFEPLEERRLLAVLTVNNPTDTAVTGELSLRQAVAQANLDAAAGQSDTIAFAASLGSQTISLTQGSLELTGAGGGTITLDGSAPASPLRSRADSITPRCWSMPACRPS